MIKGLLKALLKASGSGRSETHRRRGYEAWFQYRVCQAARDAGWKVYYTRDSRGSPPGYPDLTLVHPQAGILFAELRTDWGKLSEAQVGWINAINAAGGNAQVWRPRQSRWICRSLRIDPKRAKWLRTGRA